MFRLKSLHISMIAVLFSLSLAAPNFAATTYKIHRLGLTGSEYAPYLNPRYFYRNKNRMVGYSTGVNGTDSWIFDGKETIRVGLPSNETQPTKRRHSDILGINSIGMVIGKSARFHSESGNNTLGYDAWLYDGLQTHQIGLVGGIYEIDIDNDGYYKRLSEPTSINNNGNVAGYSNIYHQEHKYGEVDGRDAWIYQNNKTVLINPTGDLYEYDIDGRKHRRINVSGSKGLYINDCGQVNGASHRYSDTGVDLGNDAWFYDTQETKIISLTGDDYEYQTDEGRYRNSLPKQCNNLGDVIGHSKRYATNGNELGTDVWFYDGDSTKRIGFVGSDYEYSTSNGVVRNSFSTDTYVGDNEETNTLNNAGNAIGYSKRYSSDGTPCGQDTWLYKAGTTKQIGLTGTDYEYRKNDTIKRHSRIFALSNAENPSRTDYVVGSSDRFSKTGIPCGEDAWLYDGNTTIQVGLTGNEYEYGSGSTKYRSNTIFLVMWRYAWGADIEITPFADNYLFGSSNRYGANGEELGNDLWVYNDGEASIISLTGDTHEYTNGSGTRRSAEISHYENEGIITGTNKRYDANGNNLGQTAWFYDCMTKETIDFDISLRSDGYASSFIQHVSENREVIGTYHAYDDDQFVGIRSFWWSHDTGFLSLDTLVTNLADSEFTSVSDIMWSNYSGMLIGLEQNIDGEWVGYALIPEIPEPSTLVLLGVGLLFFSRSYDSC